MVNEPPPRRRTGNIRRSKPDRRYHTRRWSTEERRKPPVEAVLPDTRHVLHELWASFATTWTAEIDTEDDQLVAVRDHEGRLRLFIPVQVFEELKKRNR